MQQQTGSVYLDAPPRSSRQPIKRSRSRTRASIAATCVALGVLALIATILVGGLRALVFDPEPALAAVETTFDDPIAREELEEDIAAGIANGLVGEELVAVAAVYGLDVAAEANRVSLLVLDDPEVREQLRLLASDIHSRVVLEPRSSAIDLAPLTASVLAVLERESPQVAGIIPPNTLLWTVEGDALPDLTAAGELTDRAFFSLMFAVLLIPLGLAIHPRRHRVAAWVGRSSLVFGLSCALAAVGLPYLAGGLSGYSAAEIAVRAVSLKLLAPAAVAGIAGMGLVSFAAVLQHRERRQVTDEGAAAALGYDEPPFFHPPAPPTLDLGSRGLLEVSHPLTNV